MRSVILDTAFSDNLNSTDEQQWIWRKNLKSDSHLPEKVFITCFNDSPLKMMKNAFYFILKAIFVLKIVKFLSWLFGHLEKTARLEK